MSISLPSAYLNKLKELFAAKEHGTHVSSDTCVTSINGSKGDVSLTIPQGTVKKVNNVLPDSDGNVTLNITGSNGISIETTTWKLVYFNTVGSSYPDTANDVSGTAIILRFTYGTHKVMIISGTIPTEVSFQAGAYWYIRYPYKFATIPVTVIQPGNTISPDRIACTQNETTLGAEYHTLVAYSASNFGFIAIGTY